MSGVPQLHNLQGWWIPGSLLHCCTALLVKKFLLIPNLNFPEAVFGIECCYSFCCIREEFGSVVAVTPHWAAVGCKLITLKPPLHPSKQTKLSRIPASPQGLWPPCELCCRASPVHPQLSWTGEPTAGCPVLNKGEHRFPVICWPRYLCWSPVGSLPCFLYKCIFG